MVVPLQMTSSDRGMMFSLYATCTFRDYIFCNSHTQYIEGVLIVVVTYASIV